MLPSAFRVQLTITSAAMSRQSLPEGSGAAFAVKVYDDSTDVWALSVPTSLRYRVDNPDTGASVTGWTSVTADDDSTISLNGSTQALQCQGEDLERRRITVQANAGLATQCTASFDWWVVNSVAA